ncbi:hypothetical protein Tco_1068776 [Tanacetum coccineum]|uniref:Uncharacterized protein n=1 Tax=Tanacetum coccineum TaxID=301880 RepID=A0ABQ5HI43_9ASTR
MEAQYGKFLDVIRVVRINVPLIDVSNQECRHYDIMSQRTKIQALEKETWDLDVENKQKKMLKASYGVTTPHELRLSKLRENDPTLTTGYDVVASSYLVP